MWIRLLVIVVALVPIALAMAAPYIEGVAQEKSEVWDQVSEANLKGTVTRLVSFGTRMSLSTQGIGEAREWLKSEFDKVAKTSKSAMKVDFHEFTDMRLVRDGELVPQKNVYAMVPGKKYPKQVIVFGAHYDSVNLQDRTNVDVVAPGANDNATGTASVLEAARILSQVEHDRTICFVAFASEEQGLIGAFHFANWLKDSGMEVLAMLNNDIVGGAKDDDGKPLNEDTLRCFSVAPQESSSRQLARLAKIVVEKRCKEFKIALQDAQDRPGRAGDHLSFNKVGFTAIRFIEGVETDKVHHTPNDTIDRIHFPFHVRATKADIALLDNLANAPEATKIVDPAIFIWDPVKGAAGYLVGIRKGGLEFAELKQVTEPRCAFAGADATQVSVAVVDKAGRISLFSPEVALPDRK